MDWKNPVVPGLVKGKFLLVRPQKSLVRDVGLWDLISPVVQVCVYVFQIFQIKGKHLLPVNFGTGLDLHGVHILNL